MQHIDPEPPDISEDILKHYRCSNITDIKPFYNKYTKKLSDKLWIPNQLTEDMNKFTEHLDFYTEQITNPITIKINKELEPVKFIYKKIKNTDTYEEPQRCITFPIFFNNTVRKFIDLHIDAFETYYNLAIDEINKRFINKKTIFENSTHCIYKKINLEKNNKEHKKKKKDLKIISIDTCSNTKCEKQWFCEEHTEEHPLWELDINETSIRHSLVFSAEKLNKLDKNHELKKFTNTMYEVRDQAIKSAINAYKSSVSNLLHGNISKFELKHKDITKKFRKRMFECTEQGITYDTQNKEFTIGTNTYYKFCKSNNFEKSKPIISIKQNAKEWIDNNYKGGNFKIYRTCSGKYFIILNTKLNKITNTDRNKIISIDPGIRSFITGYDPSGTIIESYDETIYRIKDNYKRIDKNNSIISSKDKLKISGKKHKKLKRMNNKKYNKIKNIVNDMHNKVSNYLTSNYETILYPPLKVKDIINSFKASLSTGAVGCVLKARKTRLLNTLSFNMFNNKLIAQAEKHNTKLYLVTEAYTSKTCTKCGLLNEKLKDSKRFNCNKCNLKIDRDQNGARNILLKHIEWA